MNNSVKGEAPSRIDLSNLSRLERLISSAKKYMGLFTKNLTVLLTIGMWNISSAPTIPGGPPQKSSLKVEQKTPYSVLPLRMLTVMK